MPNKEGNSVHFEKEKSESKEEKPLNTAKLKEMAGSTINQLTELVQKLDPAVKYNRNRPTSQNSRKSEIPLQITFSNTQSFMQLESDEESYFEESDEEFTDSSIVRSVAPKETKMWGFLGNFVKGAASAVSNVASGVKNVVSDVGNAVSDVGRAVSNVTTAVVGHAVQGVANVVGNTARVVSGVANAVGGVANAVGGAVGPGRHAQQTLAQRVDIQQQQVQQQQQQGQQQQMAGQQQLGLGEGYTLQCYVVDTTGQSERYDDYNDQDFYSQDHYGQEHYGHSPYDYDPYGGGFGYPMATRSAAPRSPYPTRQSPSPTPVQPDGRYAKVPPPAPVRGKDKPVYRDSNDLGGGNVFNIGDDFEGVILKTLQDIDNQLNNILCRLD